MPFSVGCRRFSNQAFDLRRRRRRAQVNIRRATVDDLLHMQSTNLHCLPENYQQVLASTGELFLPAVA